jgi:hypothetical protein
VRRVAAFVASGLALSVMCSSQREGAAAVTQRAYLFYFYESTGANKYVLVDGAERAIEFDQETSDQAAVKALLSLKWNVLYPNSKGVITLLGTYHPNAHTFSLQHWFLPAPFQTYPGETTLEPGPLQWRNTLNRDDFSPVLGDEPHTFVKKASREEERRS